jgi:hypothetical protein
VNDTGAHVTDLAEVNVYVAGVKLGLAEVTLGLTGVPDGLANLRPLHAEPVRVELAVEVRALHAGASAARVTLPANSRSLERMYCFSSSARASRIGLGPHLRFSLSAWLLAVS